jgi:Notch-like protein
VVTGDEILRCFDQLVDKKTPDMTGLSTNLLKNIPYAILTPLAHIFTQSLATGIVPSKLKIAKVVPIFKTADSSDINNYRPISLLSSFSKILEKLYRTDSPTISRLTT